MLKSDVVLRLSKEFGDSTLDVDATNLFRNWIDDRYLKLQKYFPWLHNEAFVDLVVNQGDTVISLGTNIRRIKSIRDIDNKCEIIYRSKEDLVRHSYDLEQQGRPYYWYYSGYDPAAGAYSITLINIPDATYNLSISADRLSKSKIEDNEHIPIPNELLDVLFDGVRADANNHEDISELAASYEARFENGITVYKKNVEYNPADYLRNRQNSDLHFVRGSYTYGLQIPRHIG